MWVDGIGSVVLDILWLCLLFGWLVFVLILLICVVIVLLVVWCGMFGVCFVGLVGVLCGVNGGGVVV